MNETSTLHPRNPHRERYPFDLLTAACPELKPFVLLSPAAEWTIDFADPEAVKWLNKALLKHYYGVQEWDIPPGYLCPPVPGRADYLHHIADLLAASNKGKIPKGKQVKCLDVGVGANCIYPIIGAKVYGWSFVGTDIDPVAIASAQKIIASNPALTPLVECRLQPDAKSIFNGMIRDREYFDLTVCNPPFHDSPEAAQAGSIRKVTNLTQKKTNQPVLNFGGQNAELWCEGGELAFIQRMIQESRQFGQSCYWFSTLVSKQSNLKDLYAALEKAGVSDHKTLPMAQGNKISRVLAWTFLNPKQQAAWQMLRWGK